MVGVCSGGVDIHILSDETATDNNMLTMDKIPWRLFLYGGRIPSLPVVKYELQGPGKRKVLLTIKDFPPAPNSLVSSPLIR